MEKNKSEYNWKAIAEVNAFTKQFDQMPNSGDDEQNANGKGPESDNSISINAGNCSKRIALTRKMSRYWIV